ncbi:hypothetical protein K1719_041545 [Acacia pycnantha]|nr:hypothetical protein K1719_041545 [Acacia pycnantha]
MTEQRDRGKYACIAILIDLSQSLIPWIKVDGNIYGIEYEGLPHICFACGKYGHTEGKCPAKAQPSSQVESLKQGPATEAGTPSTTVPIPRNRSNIEGASRRRCHHRIDRGCR